MLPDVGKGALSDIAAICIQKTARLNVSPMRDKAKTDTAQTTPCYGVQSMGFKGDRLALFFGPLSEDTIVVRGTGGLEVQRCFVSLVIKPVQCFFIFGGVDFRVDDILSATGGNQ